MSFRVPAAVVAHRGKLLKAAIDRAHLIYDNCDRLDRPLKDEHGATILPALPFLLRALDKEEDGSPRNLTRRRRDFLQGFLSAWLVMISSTSHRSRAILSRRFETSTDKFMSLREWERLAELAPKGGYAPSLRTRTQADGTKVQVEVEEAGDRIERYTRLMRELGMLHETKQHRARLDDGRHRAAGAGIRRIVWKGLYAFGGKLASLAKWMQDTARKKADKEREDQAKTDEQIRRQFEEQERLLDERDDVDELAADPAPRGPGAPDPTLMDDVHDAHPDWTPTQIIAEARRLEAEIAAVAVDTS